MTVPRVVLFAMAVLALLDGDVWVALGIGVVVLVLVVCWPSGVVQWWPWERYAWRERRWRDR